jgi:hypothetical protein
MIDEAADAASGRRVSQDAFNRWNKRMRRQGKAVQVYIVDCNRGLNSYFVNSQQGRLLPPQTITGSRRSRAGHRCLTRVLHAARSSGVRTTSEMPA